MANESFYKGLGHFFQNLLKIKKVKDDIMKQISEKMNQGVDAMVTVASVVCEGIVNVKDVPKE